MVPIENPSPIVTAPVLGFIGREWERKGLLRVLEILQAIPEAMARGIGVLASNAIGAAAEVGTAGRVLPHTSPKEQWIQAARDLLTDPPDEYPSPRLWSEVAADYEALYTAIRH